MTSGLDREGNGFEKGRVKLCHSFKKKVILLAL